MRCIFVILDGIGDRGHPQFDGKTPLQVARTPNLDRLAQLGMNGLYHPYYQGTAMPSEIAHLLMLGYDLREIPGRGYLEALGAGVHVNPTDVALLAKLVTVTRQGDMLILQDEDPEIDRHSCYALQNAIRTFKKDDAQIELVVNKSTASVLMLRGDFSPHLTDSNPVLAGRPLMQVTPIRGHENEAGAVRAAGLLNIYLRLSHFTLIDQPVNRTREERGLPPVNAIATQRAGQLTSVTPFREKWGLRGVAMAAGTMYRGLCSLLEWDNLLPPITVDPEQDLIEQFRQAKDLTAFDFIYIHTKAPDEAAHTKNPEAKKAAIESVDRSLKYALDELAFDDNILFVVTADHSTPSSGKMIHSGETVPLTIVGKHVRRDTVNRFDEISGAAGGLGIVRGRELMYLILNFMDRGKLWGLRDSPADVPYYPGRYRILRI